MTTESSPEERVAFVRRGREARNAGDLGPLVELFDPEIEVYSSPKPVNAGTYRGYEGFVRWSAAWDEAWGSFAWEIAEIVPVGARHVVAEVRQTGRGRGSGVEVTMDVGYVYEVHDGRCSHLGLYSSYEEAMAIAREREGMEPEGS